MAKRETSHSTTINSTHYYNYYNLPSLRLFSSNWEFFFATIKHILTSTLLYPLWTRVHGRFVDANDSHTTPNKVEAPIVLLYISISCNSFVFNPLHRRWRSCKLVSVADKKTYIYMYVDFFYEHKIQHGKFQCDIVTLEYIFLYISKFFFCY